MIPSPETTATVMACIFAILPVASIVGAVITQFVYPGILDWFFMDAPEEDEGDAVSKAGH